MARLFAFRDITKMPAKSISRISVTPRRSSCIDPLPNILLRYSDAVDKQSTEEKTRRSSDFAAAATPLEPQRHQHHQAQFNCFRAAAMDHNAIQVERQPNRTIIRSAMFGFAKCNSSAIAKPAARSRARKA